jgi:hypothetical protein
MLYVDVNGLGAVTVRIIGDSDFKSGDRIGLQFDEDRCRFFTADGQAVNVE